ncbi:MAG TPA: tyrosine-type recombinase/integrase [Firmicutes bacterium]|nr:tyrosine-type recombinase/integrase [Bacillota bacterium]
MQIEKVVAEFLFHLKVEKAASPLTLKAYRGDLKHLVSLCQTEGLTSIDQVTTAHLRRLLMQRQATHAYAPNTVGRFVNAYRSFFRFCLEQEYITKNPMLPIKPPKRTSAVPVYMTPAEVKRLLTAAERKKGKGWMRDRTAIELLLMTGVRRSELISLNWDDVDFGAGTITVRKAKGRKQRVIPMHPILREHLWEYLQTRLPLGEERAIVVGLEGRRIERNALNRLFRRNLRLAGLEGKGLTLHKCRHTFATLVLNSGTPVNLFQLQELLGHADPKSTSVYAHVDTRQLGDLVAAVRFAG